jgi:hypothetical protein
VVALVVTTVAMTVVSMSMMVRVDLNKVKVDLVVLGLQGHYHLGPQVEHYVSMRVVVLVVLLIGE